MRLVAHRRNHADRAVVRTRARDDEMPVIRPAGTRATPT